ncbi:uncharacterized protein LOC126835588 [Adelges cooleyi]|uniref:uncharacterized protein LOC126835588 n=1 Tax=Adelges cooleyi TaxID=133065 RepID=UPI0021809B7E|nr:uncharacterized protein LOC126835588 [Adelges cooleyi]
MWRKNFFYLFFKSVWKSSSALEFPYIYYYFKYKRLRFRCGGGDNPPFKGTTWDDIDNEYSKPIKPSELIELSELSEPGELSEQLTPRIRKGTTWDDFDNEYSKPIKPSELIELSEPSEREIPIMSQDGDDEVTPMQSNVFDLSYSGVSDSSDITWNDDTHNEYSDTCEQFEPSEPSGKDTPILSHYEVYDPNFDYRANFDYSGCPSVQGDGGTVTLNSGGNRESINAISGFVHVWFRKGALFINGIKVTEVQGNDVRLIQWAEGSLNINGKTIERFNGMRGYGTIRIL